MARLKTAMRLPDLLRGKSGAMAVEFALLLPVLIGVYALVFESGRGWLTKQKFEAAVEVAARFAARHPEFEKRVRAGLPVVVREIAKPLAVDDMNLALYSATIEHSAPRLAFPKYRFFGDEKAIDWTSSIKNGLFAEGEAVIVVTGSYAYTPIYFGALTGPIKFEHAVALNPFFSRSYNYQDGDSDWKYFNVR